MSTALVFSGQGSQYAGMGRKLIEAYPALKDLLVQADEVVGYNLSEIMQTGSDEDLRQTVVTQPAVYVYSAALYQATKYLYKPVAVAGHSLGEYSALFAAGVVSFLDGLRLVKTRAEAMQKACVINPSTMSAVLGLDDEQVIAICASVTEGVVVAANQNCPGQIVISGSFPGIEAATEKLKAAGAKRVLPLSVGGAFHSPLMQPATEAMNGQIDAITFADAQMPIYQNLEGKPTTSSQEIKAKLKLQMINPVLWTATIRNMRTAGIAQFVEVGPGNVLQGLVKKIDKEAETSAALA